MGIETRQGFKHSASPEVSRRGFSAPPEFLKRLLSREPARISEPRLAGLKRRMTAGAAVRLPFAPIGDAHNALKSHSIIDMTVAFAKFVTRLVMVTVVAGAVTLLTMNYLWPAFVLS